MHGYGCPGVLSKAVTWLPEQAPPSLSLGSFGTRGRGMATCLACGQDEGKELAKALAQCQLWLLCLRHQGGWRVLRSLENSQNHQLLPRISAPWSQPKVPHIPHAPYSVLPAAKNLSACWGHGDQLSRQTDPGRVVLLGSHLGSALTDPGGAYLCPSVRGAVPNGDSPQSCSGYWSWSIVFGEDEVKPAHPSSAVICQGV